MSESSDGGGSASDPADGGAPPADGGAPPTQGSASPADAAATPADGGADPADANASPADAGAELPEGGAPPDGPTDSSAAPPADDSADPDSASTVAAAKGDGTGDDANTVAGPLDITLQVQCGHTSSGIRQVTGNTVLSRLQIVASTGQSSVSSACSGLQGKLKITASQTMGGTDTVQASLILPSDGDTAGQAASPVPQIAFTQNQQPADGDWQTETTLSQDITNVDDTDIFTMDVQPTLWQVFARGNPDDLPQRVQLEIYPSNSVKLNVDQTWFDTIKGDFTATMTKVVEGLQQSLPFTITPSLVPPAGSLSISVGWQENSDWTASYVLTIAANLNPLFGMGLNVKVKAIEVAAYLVGVPGWMTKYLGGINLTFGISGQLGVTGNVTFTGPNISGSLGPTGQIKATVGAEAVIGNTDVKQASIGASVAATASGGISWSGKLDPPSTGGLVLHQTITRDAVVGDLVVTLYAFSISQSKDSQITFWPASDPAQLPDWSLIDGSSSS